MCSLSTQKQGSVSCVCLLLDSCDDGAASALGQLISVTRPVETVGYNITSEDLPASRSVKTQSYIQSVPLLDSIALLSTPHSSLVLLSPPPEREDVCNDH